MTAPAPLAFAYTADAGYADRLARAQFRELRLRNVVVTAAGVAVIALGGLALNRVFAVLALALAVFSAAVEVIVFLGHLRVARRTSPAGRSLAVEYGPIVMHSTDPDGDAYLPYAELKDARERGRFVALVRKVGQPLLLPVELCPPEALAVVRAGILANALPALDEQQFPHRAHPGPDYGRAVSRRTLVLLATDPTALGFAGAIAVIGTGLWLVMGSIAPLVVSGILLVAWPFSAVLSVRASFTRQVGADPLFARFDAGTFTTAHRGSVSRLRYDAFDRIEDSRGAVELRSAASRQWHLFPAELFPPEARERFRAAAAAAPAAPTAADAASAPVS